MKTFLKIRIVQVKRDLEYLWPINTPANNIPVTATSPTVAVVILNWNGKSFLQKFLPSVQETAYSNFKIIVADNASTDDSVDFLKSNFPQIEIIELAENGGYAKGYNLALQQVSAEYYVLLNSDVRVTPNWISPVINLMERDESISACQPKILSFNQPDHFEYAGAGGGWIDSYGYPFCRGRVFDTIEKDSGQYDTACPCFWASGAAMFVRASLFHKLGGFDESFFAHQEEIDLCWRMQSSGYKVYVEPASVVFHVGGGTLPKGSRKTYLNFRNSLLMMHKNLTPKARFRKLPLRMLLDGIAAWRALFSGDPGFFAAVFKAHAAYTVRFFFGEKIVSSYTDVKISAGIYQGSIVSDYFIKKKKTFREIVDEK